MNNALESLKVKLFADGADIAGIVEMANKPYISGLTTNPTLMRKAGVSDYVKFAKEVLYEIKDKPISFEVFSDDLNEMKIQGEKIASWGSNVNVKIPITNTKGISTAPVISNLSNLGISINVTALMTPSQVTEIKDSLNPKVPSYISVFAGRIADTGRDPLPLMKECLDIVSNEKKFEIIWASPREVLNIIQANQIGCHIITATNDILLKLPLIGKNLMEFSLETVEMFRKDATLANYKI